MLDGVSRFAGRALTKVTAVFLFSSMAVISTVTALTLFADPAAWHSSTTELLSKIPVTVSGMWWAFTADVEAVLGVELPEPPEALP